jgi:peptidylprolyl isomerase
MDRTRAIRLGPVLLAGMLVAGCEGEAPDPPAPAAARGPEASGPGALAPLEGEPLRREALAGGLVVEVFRDGSGGAVPADGVAVVLFRLALADGAELDSSALRRGPLRIPLAGTGTIEGLARGLAGARPGERRRLRIPSALAYGERGRPPIPPRADLVFELELVEWAPAAR